MTKDITNPPVMTTVAGRPTSLQRGLNSINGVLVQCRLADGVDTFVPLKDIFALFEQDLARKVRIAQPPTS